MNARSLRKARSALTRAREELAALKASNNFDALELIKAAGSGEREAIDLSHVLKERVSFQYLGVFVPPGLLRTFVRAGPGNLHRAISGVSA